MIVQIELTMLAMQYSISLPIGYDTALVRERVKKRSKLFQGLAGMKHKSYLLSEADHIYAPFYIWSDVAQARQFLFDDLFSGVVQAFRRPRVRTWMVLDAVYGTDKSQPRFAMREADIIPPEENLEALFKREKEAQAEIASHKNLHFHAIALDAERWELLRYSLWKNEASAAPPTSDCVQTYEVLHSQGG
jgi:Domain of unknown function (DUF4865)